MDADHDKKNWDKEAEADAFELAGQLSVLGRAQQRDYGSRQKCADDDLYSQRFGEHHEDQQRGKSGADFDLRRRMAEIVDDFLQRFDTAQKRSKSRRQKKGDKQEKDEENLG